MGTFPTFPYSASNGLVGQLIGLKEIKFSQICVISLLEGVVVLKWDSEDVYGP